MSAAGGEFVRHLSGSGWAPVSRKMMDDERLTVEARGTLAWLITRPDDHRIFVRYAQIRLGLTQSRWQRVRRELERAGYLVVQKSRAGKGKFCWHYHLFDVPEEQKQDKTGISTIGQKSTDGKTIGRLSAGGKSTDNKRHTKRETSVLDKYLQDNATFSGSVICSQSQNLKSESENQNQFGKEEDGKREEVEELIVRLAKTTTMGWKDILATYSQTYDLDVLKAFQNRFTNIRKRQRQAEAVRQ